MEIKRIENGSELTIQLVGRLDSTTSGEFESAIINKTGSINKLVLDMAGVDFISSKGIRIILLLKNEMDAKGSLEIINCNNAVKEVFRLSGLLAILGIK